MWDTINTKGDTTNDSYNSSCHGDPETLSPGTNYPIMKLKKKLMSQYFFTCEQINEVFTRNPDIAILEQIVDDVEQQYESYSFDKKSLIGEYLYQALLCKDYIKNTSQEILDDIYNILDTSNPDTTKIITCEDFKPLFHVNEWVWKNMLSYMDNHINDFFVINIQNDIGLPPIEHNDEVDIDIVKKYFSDPCLSVSFYVFLEKSWIKKIAVHTEMSSWSRENGFYFSKLAEVFGVNQVDVPLSRFVHTSGPKE